VTPKSSLKFRQSYFSPPFISFSITITIIIISSSSSSSFFVCCQAFFNPNPDPVCIQTRVPVLKVYINVNTYGDIRLVPKGPKKRRKSKCSMRFLE
jgi:hypothetical protein